MVHFQLTYDEAKEESLGKWIDPDDYTASPWMLCHTGDAFAQGTRVDARIDCPECKKQRFAYRINPRNFDFSPKLSAIVGAIIGHDYGVRDARGGHLTSISITSDGFILAVSTASSGGGAFLGDARELETNLTLLIAELSAEDAAEFLRVYSLRVKDWRR
jgi:hypothetical protein